VAVAEVRNVVVEVEAASHSRRLDRGRQRGRQNTDFRISLLCTTLVCRLVYLFLYSSTVVVVLPPFIVRAFIMT
jgi:hypothetical protein